MQGVVMKFPLIAAAVLTVSFPSLSIAQLPADWFCNKPLNSDRELAENEFKQSDTVFEGELLSHEDQPTSHKMIRLFTYRVVIRYKGPEQDKYIVEHEPRGCDFEFTRGQKYLVYASGDGHIGLRANLFGRTNLLERAGADLRYLRGEAPTEEDLMSRTDKERRDLKPRTGTVCGHILGPDGKPFEDAVVYVRTTDHEKQAGFARSEEDGSYRAELVLPGTYLVAAYGYKPDFETGVLCTGVYPAGRRLTDAAPIVVLAQSEACTIDFQLTEQPVHTVTGVLQMPENTRFPEKALIDIKGTKESALSGAWGGPLGLEPLWVWRTTTMMEKDGSFRLSRMPPGHYSIQAFLPNHGKLSPRTEDGWESGIVEIYVSADQDVRIPIKRWKP